MSGFLTFLLYFILSISDRQKVYSPLDFGLKSARDGEQRFEAVYQAHKAAYEHGGRVSYEGIDTIDLTIPEKAKSIPLVPQTDFDGVVFHVLNTKTDFYLFSLNGPKPVPINVGKKSISRGVFRRYLQLIRGNVLVIIEDKNPWVLNRKGYDYGAIRKDILYVRNGQAVNQPISTYDNPYSDPGCSYIPCSAELKYVRNVTLSRDARSTNKTFLIRVTNLNNVELSGLKVITPEPVRMERDAAIRIMNCTNALFKDVTIDRTYSGENTVGYGIVMDNVWNVSLSHIKADGNWGVFDNNNISEIMMSDSEINRFDVHCYGRDFTFDRCRFSRLGQPLSSFFGKLRFKDCQFDYATSCSYRQEYNAYTPFDIEYENCVFNLDKQHASLINLINLSDEMNARPELSRKSIPNISMKDCIVHLSADMTKWEIVHVGKVDYREPLSGVSKILIDGLKVTGADANIYLFSTGIKTMNEVTLSFSHLDLLQRSDGDIRQATKKYTYHPSILFNINHGEGQRITVSDSRLNYNAVENPQYNISFTGCTLGRLRSYNTENGIVHSRRTFSDCKFILDCDDSVNYQIDANSDYTNCTFIPCDREKRIIPVSMEEGAMVSFENCSIQGGAILMGNVSSSDLLKNSRIEVSTKRITRKNGKPIKK